MGLISDSVPNIINGVSQQPATLRLRTQGEEQENMLSSLAKGLKRRPPMVHVAKVNSLVYTDPFVHTINRDAVERYQVILTPGVALVSAQTDISYDTTDDSINSVAGTPFSALVANDLIVVEGSTSNDGTYTVSSLKSAGAGVIVAENLTTEVAGDTTTIKQGDIRVYEAATGVERTVAVPDGIKYITDGSASLDFASVTVADFTFVVNKTKTVTMNATGNDARDDEGLVYIKTGATTTTYSIFIDGTSRATYTGSVDTIVIATDLMSDLTAWAGAGFVFTRVGNVIHIKKTTGDFALRAEDGSGNNLMTAYKDTVQNFADLPPEGAVEDFTIKVVGDDFNEFDDFWVKWSTGAATNSTGIWVETVQAGDDIAYDADTMPHQLVREANGTFTFEQVVWDDRIVGDDSTNEKPTFVGREINDIFFHNNRLGMLSDENLILSRTAEFFAFFKETATALLDSDRIDVAATSKRVNILQFAVPFNEELICFADEVQFRLTSGNSITLSPKTVSLDPTTFFKSGAAEPVGAGQNIYFAADNGEFTSVREYMVNPDTQTKDAAEITAHVPEYIPKSVTKLASDPNHDLVFAFSTEDPDAFYVYKFFIDGSDKKQSSWSRWQLDTDTTILNIDVIDGVLYLLTSRSDGTHIETMSLSPGLVDALGFGADNYLIHLDRRVSLTGVHSAGTTTWTLPYSDDATNFKVVTGTAFTDAGVSINLDARPADKTKITATGDFSDGPAFVGKEYTSFYDFSEFVVRTSNNSGGEVIQLGRLQVKRMLVNFTETGIFTITVTPTNADAHTYIYSGVVIGDAVIGSIVPTSGEFTFPVFGESKKVSIRASTNSHLPFALLTAEWEGWFKTKSQRI